MKHNERETERQTIIFFFLSTFPCVQRRTGILSISNSIHSYVPWFSQNQHSEHGVGCSNSCSAKRTWPSVSRVALGFPVFYTEVTTRSSLLLPFLLFFQSVFYLNFLDSSLNIRLLFPFVFLYPVKYYIKG